MFLYYYFPDDLYSPQAVAKCIMDLITDESDTGQMVKVTYENGVEYVNYHDVSMTYEDGVEYVNYHDVTMTF